MMDHRMIRGGTTREKEGFSKRDLHASLLWIPCDCLWIDQESPPREDPLTIGTVSRNIVMYSVNRMNSTYSNFSNFCSLPFSSHSSLSCRNFFLRVIFPFFSSPMTFFFFFFFFFIIISTNCETLPVGIREHGRKDSWPCLLSVGISAGRGKEQDATGAETFRMAIVLRLAQDRSCTLKLRITRGPKVDHFLGWFTSSNLGPLELLAQQDRAEWTTRWGRNASSRRQFDYRTWHALCTSFFPLFSPVFPFSFRPLPTS